MVVRDRSGPAFLLSRRRTPGRHHSETGRRRAGRGALPGTGIARVGDSVREGVIWAPSIWWTKLASDRRNANDTTSQRETDMGHGPVFYDNLVEVGLAD